MTDAADTKLLGRLPGLGRWLRPSWGIGTALVCLAEAFLLSNLGGMKFFPAVRWFYDIHTLWLPVVLVLAGGLLAQARRRAAAACLAGAVALAGLRVWCTHVEPELLLVRHVAVATGKLPRPIRVLHLSDMQPGRVGRHEERIVAKARALQPDLLLYTGDLIQPWNRAQADGELARMARILAPFRPPLGKLSIEGDTDELLLGKSPDELGGFRLLRGEEALVDLPGGGRLRILGLTLDQSRSVVAQRVAGWLTAGAPQDLNIVMGHAPDYVLSLGKLPVDLCLAGHTHGGQVVIPFYGAPLIASMVPRAWAKGLHAFGRTRVHVSGGAGAEHAAGLPSIRFNCPTEMTLIELS